MSFTFSELALERVGKVERRCKNRWRNYGLKYREIDKAKVVLSISKSMLKESKKKEAAKERTNKEQQ